MHRDLKPSDIIVTHNGQNVKLIDFGLSDSDEYDVLKTPAGTSGYIAPELLLPGAKSDVKADIYSLGMVIKDIAQATCDKQLMAVAEACTQHNPNMRPPSVAQIFTHARHRRKHTILLIALSAIVALLTAYVAMALLAPQQAPTYPQSREAIEADGNDILACIIHTNSYCER